MLSTCRLLMTRYPFCKSRGATANCLNIGLEHDCQLNLLVLLSRTISMQNKVLKDEKSTPSAPPPESSKSESPVPSSKPDDPPSPPVKRRGRIDPLDLSFNNPEAAFKSKTTREVIRAWFVYHLCSYNILVENNMVIMKWTRKVLGERIFIMLMKATFYGHFVAGEDQKRMKPVLDTLRSFGVKPILDYSVEEDISMEEAEKREADDGRLSESKQKEEKEIKESLGVMPQYESNTSNSNQPFADRRYQVNSARTYFYLNEANCDRNLAVFQECLHTAANISYGTGFTAVKLTALGRPQLLLQISQVIMRARQFVSEVHKGHGNVLSHHISVEELSKRLEQAGIKDTEKFLENTVRDRHGVIHFFPWSGIINEKAQLNDMFFIPSLKEGRMVKLISQLSNEEEEMFRNMIRRITELVKTAKELNVRLMIDAEQTYLQPAISRITLELMNKYNRDKATVFNTYQCYLREAFNEISTDLEQAERQKFYFGCKLVRGAYMLQERARAQAMGYEDPINPDYEATTKMYNECMDECLRRIEIIKKQGKPLQSIGIMIASHNEETVRQAIQKMKNLEIAPDSEVVCFGQLYGMCDYITFPLGQSGYSAYKYLPYGPVPEVMPYLSRRAHENKGILEKLKKEKRLLRKELFRRLIKGQIFYKPKGDYLPV